MSARTRKEIARRCILTRRTYAGQSLIRLAEDPDGMILADVAGKLPGRGAWIRADRRMIDAALADGALRKALSRSFRRTVMSAQLPDALGADIDRLLARRALDRIGLERKAGRLVTGFEKVARRLKRGQARVLLTAADAAADSRRKMALATPAGVKCYALFDRAELSLALGGENVVHAAVEPGPAADRLMADLDRLACYRGVPADSDRKGKEQV